MLATSENNLILHPFQGTKYEIFTLMSGRCQQPITACTTDVQHH